ncbi:MAG: hypothetical protein N2320_02890 [Candidatus Bipolaricaulota bacterium]|nr:hypothetical protein [Candidatus Bipolaricaulota bacterium]
MTLLGWFLLFAASAAIVIRSGLALSRAGDQIAEATGLGRLWVGTIFLAIATSLPEFVTNLSAVRLDAPALAGGNILGANMVNVVVLASLVSLFPKVAIRPVTADQRTLVVTALALTALVPALVVLGRWGNLGPISAGSLVILGGYLLGMWAVYRLRPQESRPPGSTEDPPARWRAWGAFALAAAGVLVGAPLLAASADRLSELLGLSGSFVGALAVALVTTMPETSVTWGALRLGSEEMAIGNVYGSCAFNVAILGLADLVYERPLYSALDRSHVAAGLGAVTLMTLGLVFLRLRRGKRLRLSRAVALVVLGGWAGTMFLVLALAPSSGV